MSIANHERLSVLIGAESLYGRRSGIGRMTLEIVKAAQQAMTIERVALLLGDHLMSTSVLEDLSDEGLQARPNPDAQVKIRPWLVAIGQVPGVQALRRVKNGGLGRKIRGLNRESGKRLVYHEPNMIAQSIAVP